MPLCEVVSDLAKLVAHDREPLTSREAYQLYLLAGMPKFRDAKQLDVWETAYQAPKFHQPQSDTEELLHRIFELGWFNLYGAFDPSKTQRFYQELRQEFAAKGFIFPEVVELSDW